MSTFKDLFGAACMGAGYRILKGLNYDKTVSMTRFYENEQRTETFTKNSVVGGAVRGAIAAVFFKGAYWSYGDKVKETIQKYRTEPEHIESGTINENLDEPYDKSRADNIKQRALDDLLRRR